MGFGHRAFSWWLNYWEKAPCFLLKIKSVSPYSSREGLGLVTERCLKISACVCAWETVISKPISWLLNVGWLFLLVILSVSQGRGEASSIYSSDSLSNAIFHNGFINAVWQILNWHKRAEKEKLCQFTLAESASEIIMRVRQHFRNTEQPFSESPWSTSASASRVVGGTKSCTAPPGKANSPCTAPQLQIPVLCKSSGWWESGKGGVENTLCSRQTQEMGFLCRNASSARPKFSLYWPSPCAQWKSVY